MDVTEDSEQEQDVDNNEEREEKLQAVNSLLSLNGNKPLRNTMQVAWVDASSKTRRFYTSKIAEVVSALLELVAPNDAGLLWNALKESPDINKKYGAPATSDSSLLTALVESYNQATHANTRTQILSLMADKLSFQDLEQIIPGLSRYRYTAARRHCLEHGAGTEITNAAVNVRERINPAQLEHFIEFITSQHVLQDLPFGRRKLKLSSSECLEIPNVIRTLIPSRLVSQYIRFCQETGFRPLGKSTPLQIVSESCVASVRRCMQGLDNYLAEGTKAFDDLNVVVDKLSVVGLPKSKSTFIKEALKEGKQYLKGDYKVSGGNYIYILLF